MDINLDEGPKKPVVTSGDGWDPNADLTQMTMAE